MREINTNCRVMFRTSQRRGAALLSDHLYGMYSTLPCCSMKLILVWRRESFACRLLLSHSHLGVDCSFEGAQKCDNRRYLSEWFLAGCVTRPSTHVTHANMGMGRLNLINNFKYENSSFPSLLATIEYMEIFVAGTICKSHKE